MTFLSELVGKSKYFLKKQKPARHL